MTDMLDELERLHAASTPGEWYAFDEEQMVKIGGRFYDMDPANAAFIVASHNHLPALLATLREMREALEQIQDAFKRKGHQDTCSYNSQQKCDCGAYVADAVLERARERLGAK